MAVAAHEVEDGRLAALYGYQILDTPREPGFDEIAALAAAVCGTPIAVVNLIGEGRQFFKAEVGLGVRETPLDSSFCSSAILEEEFHFVPDATDAAAARHSTEDRGVWSAPNVRPKRPISAQNAAAHGCLIAAAMPSNAFPAA